MCGTLRHFLFFTVPWYFPQTKTRKVYSFSLDYFCPSLHPLWMKCYPHSSPTWLTLPSQVGSCISSTRLNNHKSQITVTYKLIKFIILIAKLKGIFQRFWSKIPCLQTQLDVVCSFLLKWIDIVMHSKINGKCIWSYFIFYHISLHYASTW